MWKSFINVINHIYYISHIYHWTLGNVLPKMWSSSCTPFCVLNKFIVTSSRKPPSFWYTSGILGKYFSFWLKYFYYFYTLSFILSFIIKLYENQTFFSHQLHTFIIVDLITLTVRTLLTNLQNKMVLFSIHTDLPTLPIPFTLSLSLFPLCFPILSCSRISIIRTPITRTFRNSNIFHWSQQNS